MPFRYVAIIFCVNEPESPTDHVIPSERSESRNLPKYLVLSCGYFSSHVVDSSTPLIAPVGMTHGGTFSVFIGNGSVLSGAERHIGRSLRFRWWAVVFNRGVLRTGSAALRIAETMGAVSLVGGRFGPRGSKNGRYCVVCYRNNGRNGNHVESHRRERPMCRSVTLQLQPLWTNPNHPPIMSFRAQ